jgi:hypothetical protein
MTIGENVAIVNELLARNERLKSLFLYDAWKMLLSALCSDECGVVWPYFMGEHFAVCSTFCDDDGREVPGKIKALCAVFASIVKERRRRVIDKELELAPESVASRSIKRHRAQ